MIETTPIFDHFRNFKVLVSLAERFLLTHQLDAAAVFGQMAAEYCSRNHPGLFASFGLEDLLVRIGQETMSSVSMCQGLHSTNGAVNRVLHVLTQAHNVGGHTRFVWRWIQRDAERAHAVALTRQMEVRTPKPLIDAVFASGGRLFHIDRRIGGLVARTEALRRLASNTDLIVLHIHPYDVVPVIGLSGMQQRPPVIFVNHADHLFWQGVSISDVVAHFRHSGLRLSLRRRNIENKRCTILPIPVNRTERKLSRSEAKIRLGIAQDAVVLLSVASSYKFRSTNSISIIEALLPVFRACREVILVLVGPNEHDLPACTDPDIRERVRFFGRREDTFLFYQAADIYLDSIPFASVTSLLEAGSLGVPLVGYCTHPADAETLCADDPGLVQSFLYPNDLITYCENVVRLVRDQSFRERLGSQIQEEITDIHEVRWRKILEGLYSQAFSVPPMESSWKIEDRMLENETDLRLAEVQKGWGTSCNRETVVRSHYRLLPLRIRFRVWSEFRKPGALLPDFLPSETVCTSIRRLFARCVGRL